MQELQLLSLCIQFYVSRTALLMMTVKQGVEVYFTERVYMWTR